MASTDQDRRDRRALLDTLTPYRRIKGDLGSGRTKTAGVPSEVMEEILPLLPGAVRAGTVLTLRPDHDEDTIVVVVERG